MNKNGDVAFLLKSFKIHETEEHESKIVACKCKAAVINSILNSGHFVPNIRNKIKTDREFW